MVTPYTIDIPDERLAAIVAKIKAYDWSQLPDAGGWRSGVGINDLKRLGLVEKSYNVVHWSDMTSGGHFAALEQPELMLADLRAFITTVSGERP